MDRLFSPWRYTYVTESGSPGASCVLCAIVDAGSEADESALVVGRARNVLLVLNRFPYNVGHLMIVPRSHVARLRDLDRDSLHDLATSAARAEEVLSLVYRPEGFNVGINLGRAAGAGVADHVHVHVVPRWAGDSSFMTVTGETRVLPQELAETWAQLRKHFDGGTLGRDAGF